MREALKDPLSNQELYDVAICVANYLDGLNKEDCKIISDWNLREVFANAISGILLDPPIGLADVAKGNVAWTLKTVVDPNPIDTENVFLNVGRCCPDYSYSITDPHVDVEKTGRAVLNIWNERILTTLDYYDQLKMVVLVLSTDYLSFCMFEKVLYGFTSNDYKWCVDSSGRLIGKSTAAGTSAFIWQPIGSNFMIHETIPCNTVRFRLRKP